MMSERRDKRDVMMAKHKHRDAATVIQKARQLLTTASFGIKDLRGSDPARRVGGVHNTIVFGRAVTNVIQTLRGVDEDLFNKWYEPYVAEMQHDEMLRWLKKLRNEILKEGAPDATSTLRIQGFALDPARFQELMQNPPPGATSFVYLDALGGTGWKVEVGDGSTEMYYIDVPPSVMDIRHASVELAFPDPPTVHLGQPIPNGTLNTILPLYMSYLSRLVDSANKAFNSP